MGPNRFAMSIGISKGKEMFGVRGKEGGSLSKIDGSHTLSEDIVT